MKRNCDNCNKEYEADERNLKRGWGLCCSKSCAAAKREKSKPTYNADRVAANNIRRENWSQGFDYELDNLRNWDVDDSEYWHGKDFD